MASGLKKIIEADDFNSIRSKIISVLGAGSATFGYGQNIQSSTVSPGDEVEADQWNRLRWDIFNVLVHQTGATPSIVIASVNNLIRLSAGDPNFQYDTLSDQAIENRFDLGENQFAIEAGTTVSQTISWKEFVTCNVTVNFNTSDQARWFFNSGGKIRFTSTRSGGLPTQQNASWTGLLSLVGTKSFDAVTSGVNFYNLTNAEQIWVDEKPTGIYSQNEFKISVSCNVPNNSAGTATQLTFKIEWIDNYTDPDLDFGRPTGDWVPPDDLVDGTLSLIVDQVRPTGILQPAGAPFTIAGPSSYSATNFVFL